MAEEDVPFTEPTPVPDVFTTGADVQTLDGNIRVVAWVDIAKERRIVSRWVMSGETARKLMAALRRAQAH
jgi:hypothetical protein